MPDAENDAPQRQVYFRLSHEEDQEVWRAFREGHATDALNLIITRHVAREHHAGQAERADAWDEGWAAGMADAAYLARGEDVPLTRNPHRSRIDLDPASDHDPEAFIDAEGEEQ